MLFSSDRLWWCANETRKWPRVSARCSLSWQDQIETVGADGFQRQNTWDGMHLCFTLTVGIELRNRFKVETRRVGNRIAAVRLAGFNSEFVFSQTIRPDIKAAIQKQKCVMLGVNGSSVNTRIEVVHKDGRKNNPRVSNMDTQLMCDFQPLCKAANDVKRPASL